MGTEPRTRVRLAQAGRLLGVALPIVSVIVAFLVVPGYVPLLPRALRRRIIEGFLRVLLTAYIGALALALPGTVVCAWRVLQGRSRRVRRPLSARGLALAVSTLAGLLMVETGAAAWRAWDHRMPQLPTRFADDVQKRDDLHLVVIGGSSALGHPYDPVLSVGQVVAWRLGKEVAERRFSVEILARLGASLEDMHKALSGLTRRPDALIIYSGHNEFAAVFEEERDPWLDEEPRARWLRPFYWASLRSPFCRLVYETVSNNRLDGSPPLINGHHLIDPPQCSPSEFADVLANFRRRLEAIVAYCERIGALPILIIPPGNEGGMEPSRSVLPPTVTEAERRRVVAEIELAARAADVSEPARAVALYRAVLARHPNFAEAHFRLARLLEGAGRYDEANRHYLAARDADGLVIRCPTVFQDVYREVATRHSRALLVDGPAVLRAGCPHGILDDHMIQDTHHPNLAGLVALANAVVRALRERHAFGTRPGALAPTDPAECARHFGLDREKWVEVCHRVRVHFERTARYRYDPAERLSKAKHYAEAIPKILAGQPIESLGIAGRGAEGVSAP